MSTSEFEKRTPPHRSLDRPGGLVPSVDRPWDDPNERAHRQTAIKCDRSEHRVYHALYEDLLN